MSVLFCLLLVLPCVAHADAPVWVELGTVNVENGLSLPNAGDGQNEPAIVGGSKCRMNTADTGYMYFIYDRAAGRLRRPIYVTVEYFDEGLGKFQIQYDSADTNAPEHGAYKRGAIELLLDSMRWRKVTFELPDARFDHRQSLDADFRLAIGGRLAVRKVTVEMGRSENFGRFSQAEQERVAASVGKLTPPRDFQVTFTGIESPSGGEIPKALSDLGTLAPMLKILGATSVETLVRWDQVEPVAGSWDWTFYDGAISILQANGLKWTPRLVFDKGGAPPDKHVAEFAAHYGAGKAITSIIVGAEGHQSVAEWAGPVLAGVRRSLPRARLYLSVDAGCPDLPALCKAAAAADAGMIIGTQSSGFAEDFARTCLAYSTAKHFKVGCESEIRGDVTADGLTARIYGAVTSRVRGISVGYPSVMAQSGGISAWSSAYRWLATTGARKPQIAVLFPDRTLSDEFSRKAALLRDGFDFDLVDETMIRDGALERYKALLVVEGGMQGVGDRILDWVGRGGVALGCKFGSDSAFVPELFDTTGDKSPSVKPRGNGLGIYIAQGWEGGGNPVEGLVQVLNSLSNRTQTDLVPDGLVDGVYVSELGGKLLIFNSTDKDVDRELQVGIGRRKTVKIPAATISEVKP